MLSALIILASISVIGFTVVVALQDALETKQRHAQLHGNKDGRNMKAL